MAVILYLSNKLFQVVEAKGKGKTVHVQNVWQGETPEGSVINGIITDEEALLTWIKAFFNKNKLPKKDITLVVNSSQFNHKMLEFPKFRDAEIRKMIPKEFAEHRTDSTLFTYYALKGDPSDKMVKILATAVEKEFILSYISFFKQAGIEITAIESEIDGLVRLFSCSPEIQKRTCLIQILDGQEVISMLFVKGNYYYSQKNRLFHLDAMGELYKELEAIRDRLLQFATSQQIREPIKAIYLCGAGEKALNKEMPVGIVYTGSKVIFPDKAVRKKNLEFLYPVGCLLGRKRDSSIFRQLKQEQKEKKKQREMMKLLLPSGAVLAACLLATAWLGNIYFSRTQELQELQKNMYESDVANGSASYEMAQASVDAMRYKINTVENIWLHLMSYPTFNSSVEQAVRDCAGEGVAVEIRGFQRDSGVLTLEAVADDVRNINGFITSLQQQDMFEAVEYSGYTFVSGPDNYNIHVVLCMAEGAGR